MSLNEYAEKRDFSKTPEPNGQIGKKADETSWFVVQKHQASHLHYDFRLELKGVLKSWAIPKGPSLDPTQKRLAVMVEDHPFDYRDFEGTIPEGNYGAGTVMIWDEGTYLIPNKKDKNEIEQTLSEALNRGDLFFFLNGIKLKGAFHLLRTRKDDDKKWLLIKTEDAFASEKDILLEDKSVRSYKKLEEIATRQTDSDSEIDEFDFSLAPKVPYPVGPLTPMFAQLMEEPFDDPEWLFEIKWDGYRAIAEVHKDGSVQLYSRHGVSFINDYPPIVNNLRNLKIDAVFDGEIVVVDNNGKADFGLIQNYRKTGRGNLLYYLFDLLYYNGYDMRPLSLEKRKHLLGLLIKRFPHIRFSDHIEEKGTAFFRAAQKFDIEGIMAKKKKSAYFNGIRGRSWIKIKIHRRQEVVVGGFTHPRGGRTDLGSLAVGVYENGEFVYVGNVGSGFTEDELPEVKSKLAPLIRSTPPFSNPPKDPATTWVEPQLVCDVKFAEWTSEGLMRHPVFIGFRDDITSDSVHRERPFKMEEEKTRFYTPLDSDQIVTIGGKSLKLTNMSKIFWPGDGITKGNSIEYYRDIAAFILPHLKDRPQSLHRFPNGIEGKSFFHKDIEDAPKWLELLRIESESKDSITRYLLCQDEATLIYMVNLGAFEINPWLSRAGSLDFPDFMVIDLDPLECPFEYVIESALCFHDILEKADIPHYLKTSGATGMHIFVPLGATYTYDQSRRFSQIICAMVNRKLPRTTSLERLPNQRNGKVYLDFLQNIKGKTMASVYSLRPIKGAPVSTPLLWGEVNRNLSPSKFTIKEIRDRLEHYGDIWKTILGRGINMKTSLKRLANLF